MAPKKTATRAKAITVRVAAPAPVKRRKRAPLQRRVTRYAQRKTRGIRSSLSPTAKRQSALKLTAVASGAAALMGYLQNHVGKDGKKLDIPKLDFLGTCGTWGLAALAVGYYTNYAPLNAVAMGLLSVQAHELGGQMAGTSIKLTGEDVDFDEMEVVGEGEM